jgi:transcriptional regulator with PAS, ATPase and Fis domain
MYTRQNPNLAYIERKMWQYSSSPRIGIVKQLLNKLLVELDSVDENERVPLDDDFNLHEQVKHFEMDMIRHALTLTNNNQRLAAQMLGINYTTLNAKMKRYGI